MASKKIIPKAKSKFLATLVTGKREPCAFCQREVDDEAIYGKLYAIGDIQVHYFCALLSCCLVQRGKDSEGLFGFLYHDILAEVERSKKHKCSYCNTGGAGLGCSVSQCRKQFHLPCGREKNAVSLFYGNYKSFCQQHAPKQKIPDHIMAQAKIRMKKSRNSLKSNNGSEIQSTDKDTTEQTDDGSMVCVICYEPVEGFPSPRTLWPPCCARDAWFHRGCVQRMALSAGMHYIKCPLCNDKDQFYDAVVSVGLYVPDRDAAWELEQNAFAEIYERPRTCSAEHCQCPQGRAHDADTGLWDIQLCILCGTLGCHAGCAGCAGVARFVCGVCVTCAPTDLDSLATRIDEVIQQEQQQSNARARRPVMPSRMSLRRTKARNNQCAPSTSQAINTNLNNTEIEQNDAQPKRITRLDLNLKTPRKPEPLQTPKPANEENSVLKTIENTMFSPTKFVEEGLNRKIEGLGVKNVNSEKVVIKIKEKLKKPRPLSAKKKIVDNVLDQLFLDLVKEPHTPKEWCSPKKTSDITEQSEQPLEENINNEAKDENTLEKEEIKSEMLVKEDNEKELKVEDDSSNSTFQLPSEFIADHNSDDSLPLFETPKKLTTVDIQKDSSLEISENNEVVNINVVKIEENSTNNDFIKNLKLNVPVKTEKCAFKFNPTDKKALVEDKLDIDVESFKNFYLNEVDRDFQCSFNHKHNEKKNASKKVKLRTAIDFAIDATKKREEKRKKLKRKLDTDDVKKQTKKDKGIVVRYKKDKSNNIKVVCSNDNKNITESIDLTLESPNNKKMKPNSEDVTETLDLTVKTSKSNKKLKKLKRKNHRENIQVKIRFREKQLRLQITSQTKNKKIKKNKKQRELLDQSKKLKQCILQYADNCSPKKVIVKPEHDITPKKRNYVKLEKSPDALVQTSIQSFFKKVPTVSKVL